MSEEQESTEEPSGSSASPSPAGRVAGMVLLVLLLLACRMVHLGADSPPSLWSVSFGEFVDEGYRIFVPRNVVLFGTPKWNPENTHPTWLERNPLLEPLHELSFRLGGVEIENARAVSVVLYGFLLLGYVTVSARQDRLRVTLVGLLLLGFSHTLFLFSRVALAEAALAVALYGYLLTWRIRRTSSLLRELLALLALAALFSWGLKASAPLYFGLAAAGLLAAQWRPAGFESLLRAGPALGAAGAAALLVVTRDAWVPRFSTFEPLDYLSSLFSNPLQETSPFLVCAGLLATLCLVLRQSEFHGTYRAALVALALGGLLVLPALKADRLRYYVPFLPAYALLAADCFATRETVREAGARLARPRAVACFGLLALAAAALLNGINRYALVHLPGVAGPSPSQARPMTVSVIAVLAGGAAAFCFWQRRRLLDDRFLRRAVASLALLALTTSAVHTVRFWRAPSYERAAIAAALQAAVPEGSSVAGDWAPFLTVETTLRSMYMSPRFNPVARLPETRPDFILYSDTEAMAGLQAEVAALPGVRLGPSLLEARFLDRAVSLYPVLYDLPTEGR